MCPASEHPASVSDNDACYLEVQGTTARCRLTTDPLPQPRQTAVELQSTVNTLLINSVSKSTNRLMILD